MEKDLERILSELLDIKVNLIKLGPTRRLQYKPTVNEKILKAKRYILIRVIFFV